MEASDTMTQPAAEASAADSATAVSEQTFKAQAESETAAVTGAQPIEDVTAQIEVDEAPVTAETPPIQPADTRAEHRGAIELAEASTDVDTEQAEQKAAEAEQPRFSGGRASNDPRIDPKPVESVVVDTAHPILFKDVVAPPVVPVRPRPPRASNDPRGPAAQQAVDESGAASAESQSANG